MHKKLKKEKNFSKNIKIPVPFEVHFFGRTLGSLELIS